MMRISIIFFFALLLLGSSCTKEHDDSNIIEEPFSPVSSVEIGSLLITIGEDIPFSCTINDETYTSEGSGYLLLKKIILDKEGEIVLVESEGYFNEIRYVIPALNAHLHMEVKLTEYLEDNGTTMEMQSFNSELGGTYEARRVDIDIAPGSFVDANGNEYNGDVKIFGFDIFSAAFATFIRSYPQPQFYENGQSKTLNIIGGLNLELFDDSMTPIYFRDDAIASIRMKPLSSSMYTVPNELDIMYFDYDMREWKNLGVLQQDGDTWSGTITELSTIVWGVTFESRMVEMKLLTDEGVPVVNNLLALFSGQDTPSNIGFSDNEGIVRMYVPIETQFKVLIYEYKNPTATSRKDYEEVIKGDGSIVTLDDFILNSEFYIAYNGNIAGCNGNILSESAIETIGSKNLGGLALTNYIFSDDMGEFSFAFQKDNSKEVNFKAYDVNTDVHSMDFEVSIENKDEVDFGILVVCQEYEYFINYTIDNEFYTYAFEENYSFDNSGTINESTFMASVLDGADENNRTIIIVEHETEFQLNISYPIRDLQVRFNSGQTVYNFNCNSDCNHSIQFIRITENFYEGLIIYMNNTTSEETIGAFRIPIQ